MIGIIGKNNTTRAALIDVLSEYDAKTYTNGDESPDLIVLYATAEFVDGFLKTPVVCPVLVVGSYHEEADFCLSAPCRLHTLTKTVERLLNESKNAPQFENELFSFNSKKRLLVHKETDEIYHLTEKENALLKYLTQHLDEKTPRDVLLTDVWNYNPQSETHTVESHIYTLRQKIGRDAYALLANDEGGYYLVK